MQRRAAARYAALFLVVAGAASGLVATAERPHVAFDDPEFRLSDGEQFSVEDRRYEVAAVTAERSGGGGGHGGGGATVTRSATLTWTETDARYTDSWENNSTVTLDREWRVLVPDASDPDTVTFEAVQNRTAILQSDPDADDELVTYRGEPHVAVTRNDTTELVPAASYFPAPDRREYAEGDRLTYRGNETTVANVTGDGVTVAWTAPRTTEVPVSNEANVTLDGRQYFAYIPDDDTLVLESDYGAYERQTAEIATFREHRNGLLGVGVLAAAAAVLLVGMAYLPSRY